MTDPTDPDDPTDLPPEVPFEGEESVEGEDAGDDPDDASLIERARHTGVGVEDPNIVGDVGPTDIPPGGDPESAGSDVPWVEGDR